jgi:hypothetical protein
MSDTPRTDAEEARLNADGQDQYFAYVPGDFARQLERELAGANRKLIAAGHAAKLAVNYAAPKARAEGADVT